MKKALLTNPAFRYIFEIFIIVFSVTISFYIQDVLNENDRIEIKNKALSGVLNDIEGDRYSLNEGLEINKNRRKSIDAFINKKIDNTIISGIRRYKSFLGNNSNYETSKQEYERHLRPPRRPRRRAPRACAPPPRNSHY